MTTYTPENPIFRTTQDVLETTDSSHADNANKAPKEAFDNTVALKIMALGDVLEYDPSGSYAVGNYCIYEGSLYKNTTAIAEGGEAWNPEHWYRTSALDEVKEIIKDLGLGGGGSGSGVSLSAGKVTITDDEGNKLEILPNGQMTFTASGGAVSIVSISDMKVAIDWVNNTGKGIPTTVTAAQNKANSAATAASNAQSTANSAKSTADSVNTWKNTYDTLIKKLAGQA